MKKIHLLILLVFIFCVTGCVSDSEKSPQILESENEISIIKQKLESDKGIKNILNDTKINILYENLENKDYHKIRIDNNVIFSIPSSPGYCLLMIFSEDKRDFVHFEEKRSITSLSVTNLIDFNVKFLSITYPVSATDLYSTKNELFYFTDESWTKVFEYIQEETMVKYTDSRKDIYANMSYIFFGEQNNMALLELKNELIILIKTEYFENGKLSDIREEKFVWNDSINKFENKTE